MALLVLREQCISVPAMPTCLAAGRRPAGCAGLAHQGCAGSAAGALCAAGPTVIVNQRFDQEEGGVYPDHPDHSILVFPTANSYCLFDGGLGHGVLDCGHDELRVTFLVNWWEQQPQVGGWLAGLSGVSGGLCGMLRRWHWPWRASLVRLWYACMDAVHGGPYRFQRSKSSCVFSVPIGTGVPPARLQRRRLCLWRPLAALLGLIRPGCCKAFHVFNSV